MEKNRIEYVYPGGKIKAMIFTYDDGVNFDKRLINIFNEHKLKGTFFLSSNVMDSDASWPTKNGDELITYISKADAPKIYEGHEVAIHGANHPYWTNCPREYMLDQIYKDKNELEHIFGYPMRGIAYPFGSWDEYTLDIVKLLGLTYGRCAGEKEQLFQVPHEKYTWCPTRHHNDVDALDKAKSFISQKFNKQAIFCLVGHSFEFAHDQNWNVIEEFCDYISNRQEVWYASAGDVFDYHKATERLKFFDNCRKVYNPSAIDVTLTINNKLVVVSKGETVVLPFDNYLQ